MKKNLMKKLLCMLLMVLMLAAVCGCTGGQGSEQPVLPDEDSKAELFADKLNYYMPDDKNYLFSPLSVRMALALAANGATGETQNEILTAMGLEGADDLMKFNNHSKHLLDIYGKYEALNLNLVNSIWLNTDKASGDFTADYRSLVEKYYQATAQNTDDKNAVQDINGWVSEQTNGKIEDLVQDNNFTAVLVNAVYFFSHWQDEFAPEDTEKDVFHSRDGKETQIDFMNKNGYMLYGKQDGVQMLEIPYPQIYSDEQTEGAPALESAISMYVLLPDDDSKDYDEAAMLIKALEEEALTDTEVNLSLPKFHIDYGVQLEEILQRLGIEKAFAEGMADFSPMYDGSSLFINNCTHKAFIDVNEKGVEAAAATAMEMAESAEPEPQSSIDFKADKPFSFIIYDKANAEILFMGEYAYAE